MDLPQPEPVRVDTIVAYVTFHKANGDEDRVVCFVPKEIGAEAYEVGHPDHVAFVQRVYDYFGLTGEIDWRTTAGVGGNPPPATILDVNHPVIYCPTMASFVSDLRGIWQIRVVQNKRAIDGVGYSRSAYFEDDGEFAALLQEARRTDMAEAAATKTGKAAPDAEKVSRAAPPATVADLPLASKPKLFQWDGKILTCKLFAQTGRDMKDPDNAGKRIPDPNAKREAKDDLFTYKATAYQLGKIKSVTWVGTNGNKGLIILAENGVGILQTIRPKDKDEVGMLGEAMAGNHGKFKGEFTAAAK